MATGKYCAYYRVSTDRQGKSGLGLEAQRKAVADFLNGGSWELVTQFTEVESGTRRDRPELEKALDFCRRQKCTLVIAKLDRLARNVHFISGLLESRVDFVCADMPEADRTFLQMAAVFAEWEARKISERTKAALAAARARGRQLGFANPRKLPHQRTASERGAAGNRVKADTYAANVLPIVEQIRSSGATSYRAIADALNARGITTARGGKWHAATVRNICTRKSASLQAAA